MSDDNRREDSPDNDGSVISGAHYVGQAVVQGAQVFSGSVAFQSQAAERTAELLAHVERLLVEYRAELADPEATSRELRRLRDELEEEEPQQTVLRRALYRLNEFVQPVPPLGAAVGQLAQSVEGLPGQSGSGFERTQPAQPLRQSQPPAEDSPAGGKPASRLTEPEVAPLPITIYLSGAAPHRDVQAAVEELLSTAGLAILDREDPVIGSWFRRMRATMSRAARSQVVRESALTAAHIADARLILAQDATITATMMANVGPVLTSLQPTKDAVVRIGAVLIVKVDWEVRVVQLTAAQQAILDHQPQLATSPRDVIGAIGLLTASDGQTAPEPASQTAGDR